jgi:hypothetical protein
MRESTLKFSISGGVRLLISPEAARFIDQNRHLILVADVGKFRLRRGKLKLRSNIR